MKRIFIALAAALVFIFLLILIVPSWRQSLLGVSLPFNLQAGRTEPVSVVSMLLNAREIRPLSETPNLEMDETVQPEVYDLALGLLEKVALAGAEPVVNYEVKQAKLAQVGVSKPTDLLDNLYSLRLTPQAVINGFELLRGHQFAILDTPRLAQTLAPLWIPRPQGTLKPGQSWSQRWHITYPVDTLEGKRLNLEHRLTYQLAEIRPDRGSQLAKITYRGEIAVTPHDPLPAHTEVLGTGNIEGEAYLNLSTGLVSIADDRTAWLYVVRHLDYQAEELRLFDRKSRVFRPLIVPNAARSFESAMPQDGEAPDLQQVQKGKAPSPPPASPSPRP